MLIIGVEFIIFAGNSPHFPYSILLDNISTVSLSSLLKKLFGHQAESALKLTIRHEKGKAP